VTTSFWHTLAASWPLIGRLRHRLRKTSAGQSADDSLIKEEDEYKSYSIPQHCSLDGFIKTSSSLQGVMLAQMAAFDTIHVKTANGNYQLFLLDPEERRVLLQDDQLFTKPVEATVSGATCGGSMLKAGWIGVGFFLELYAGGLRLTTPVVLALSVEREMSFPLPA
jgi:hypothetical protein